MYLQTKIFKAIILLLFIPAVFAYEPATEIELFRIEKCISNITVVIRGYNTSMNSEYHLVNCVQTLEYPKKDIWDCRCQNNITMITLPYVSGDYYARAEWLVAINDSRTAAKTGIEVRHIPKKEVPRTINTTGIITFIVLFGIAGLVGIIFLIRKLFFSEDEIDKLDDKEVIDLINKL